MFGSTVLEAAIGTVLIYILLSLVCLVLNEWITRLQEARSNLLKAEVRRLLSPDLANAVEGQPLIGGTVICDHYPAYIPTSTFALALMQVGYDYTPGVKGAPGTTRVKRNWIPGSKAFELLEGLRLSASSLGPLQMRIEKWFDLAMEQASGRFKRWAQTWISAISAAIVLTADIDTISIVTHLYASAAAHQPTYFVLFWPDASSAHWYVKAAGLALTWASVSLGAPFWFDMLNKLVNLRQTGLPPDENKRQTAQGMVA